MVTYHNDVIPVRAGEELDHDILQSFLKEQIPSLPDEPLRIQQFRAGHSNLTYEIAAGEWEAVLRRPPLGPVAPKAHDMKREYQILSSLNPIYPIAPKPILYSDDTTIVGSPFFVMERKKGIVFDTEFPSSIQVTADRCRHLSEKAVAALVQLHSIDYRETDLIRLSKPEGFMERQVYGWISRYERAKTTEIAGVEQLTQWLSKNLPKSPPPTVIHYDFKLNNIMFSADLNEIVGLFDWEMATVGDPLADLGVALSYWIQEDDPEPMKKAMGKPPVTVQKGFISRDEFIQLYATKSGRDVEQMDFYLTFAYFKLAVICQQIYYRYKRGQTQDERFGKLDRFVKTLMEYALHHMKS